MFQRLKSWWWRRQAVLALREYRAIRDGVLVSMYLPGPYLNDAERMRRALARYWAARVLMSPEDEL